MNGTVEFEAGGKAYTMRMTTNAQVRYQRAAGETLLQGLVKIQEDPSDIDRLRRLIWASMSHVEDMTEDAAGDVMDTIGIETAIGKLSEAVAAAYPKATSGNAPRAKKSPT
jgi:hypothetical protein